LHIKPTSANVCRQFDTQTDELGHTMRDAVIVEAVRRPVGRGKPGGALSGVGGMAQATIVERLG
jgi:hypothetical protein